MEAHFLRRLNRFTVEVEVAGRREAAHLPNSGRLRELLLPGAPCLLLPVRGTADRRTSWDLVALRHGGPETGGAHAALAAVGSGKAAAGPWVSVDARLPPRLLAEAVGAGRLRPFLGWRVLRREPRSPVGRFDLLLEEEAGGAHCHVEAKSVTLVVDGEARFPDAPTGRGRRHLEELARLAAAGRRACVCFVVQRPDARFFAPNAATDPAFASALAAAAAAGVEVLAWRCCTARGGIMIRAEIPVRGVS